MSDLVRRLEFGDITFGAPEGIELLHTPWGYYTLLGVSRDASPDEIDHAYKRLAVKLHPDKHPNDPDPKKTESAFKSLAHVAEILLDDGGKLGPQHSRRRHYDEVCRLETDFDGYITHKGDRTRKLSEIMLIKLELQKKEAEVEQKTAEKFPEFTALKERLQRARSDATKEQLVTEMSNMAAQAAGLPPEEIPHFREVIEESARRFEQKQREFGRSFSNYPNAYFSKVLDVFYVGDGHVTFWQDRRYMKLGLVGHENREHILELVLAGDCYIAGFPKVHFKANEANVTLSDPNVEGIFHIVKGDVNVQYDTATYGEVIHARSPNTRVVQGFVQRGDLYVPESFATQNWWRKKPAVEIVVREGSISLQLASQQTGPSKFYIPSDSTMGNSLEDIIGGFSNEYINNRIDKDPFNIIKKYEF